MIGSIGSGGWGSYASSAAYMRYASASAVHRPATSAPVEPVTPVTKVAPAEQERVQRVALPAASQPQGAEAAVSQGIPFLREGVDPVAMAVRSRIQYPEQMATAGGGSAQAAAASGGVAISGETPPSAAGLPGEAAQGGVPLSGELPPAMAGAAAHAGHAQGAEEAAAEQAAAGSEDVQSAQEVMEEAECQTCSERKYQDGSDDPGVSFKTATNLSPEEAATAVRGHEMEHVVRERAKAEQEDRKVVSQSVTLHTQICPECGRAYVSGGTTRTVTMSDEDPQQAEQEQAEKERVPLAS